MDAIDTAIYEFVNQENFKDYTVIDHEPFDPCTKRAISTVQRKDKGEVIETFKVVSSPISALYHFL